jgi:hypothetical protein
MHHRACVYVCHCERASASEYVCLQLKINIEPAGGSTRRAAAAASLPWADGAIISMLHNYSLLHIEWPMNQ